MSDCISRQATIDVLDGGAELLRRVLDDADIVGVERAKYEWGLDLIESYISDVKELPPAQPEIIHCGECELKIECCRNIRSGGRKDDDFCSCGRRAERRTDG